MGIGLRTLSGEVKSRLNLAMQGKVFVVDLAGGDDNASGRDLDHALLTIPAALEKVVSYRGDVILVTNTGSSPVSVSSSITIDGKHGFSIVGIDFFLNRRWPRMARLDQADDTVMFDIDDGSDIFISHLNITVDDSATPVALFDIEDDCDGIAIANCIFKGSNSVACIGIDAGQADWLSVVNCWFEACKYPFDVDGDYAFIEGNDFYANVSGAKGIVLGANAANCMVRENYLDIRGTGGTGVVVMAGATDNRLIDNRFNAACEDEISDSGTGTVMSGNIKSGITTSDGTSTTQDVMGFIED